MSKEEFGGKSAEVWAIYVDITLKYVEIYRVRAAHPMMTTQLGKPNARPHP